MRAGILRAIRFGLLGRAIAAFLCVLIGGMGCSSSGVRESTVDTTSAVAELKNDQAKPTALTASTQGERAYSNELRGASFDRASARDIFRGVLFSDGPVVELIPSVKKNAEVTQRLTTPEQRAAGHLLLDRLMDDMERRHPGTLEAFKTELVSRDHLRIQRALVTATRLAKASFKELPETKDLDFDNPDPTNRGLCGIVVFVVGVVVLVVAVAGAAAAVVVVDAGLFIHVTEVYTKSVDQSGFFVFTDPNQPSGCPFGDCGDIGSGSQSLLVETLVQDVAELPVPVWAWAHTSTAPNYDVVQATFYTDGNKTRALKLADFSGDGKLDRAYFDLKDTGTEQVSIVEGRNCPDQKCPADLTEAYPRGSVPVVGDFDGNGRADILVWTAGAQHPIWYFTSGTQHSVSTLTRPGTSGTNYRVVAGDFNGDNIDDLFWYGTGNTPSEVLLGAANGTFSSVQVPLVGGNRKPVVGKFFPGAGDDILFYDPSVSDYADHPLWDLEAASSGPSNLAITFYTAGQKGGAQPIPADVNGNGRQDFLWYFTQGSGDTAIQQWLFNDLTEVDLTISNGPGPGTGFNPVWGDTNDNGYADVIWWPFAPREVPVNLPPIAVCKPVTMPANGTCQAAPAASSFDGGTSDPEGTTLTYSISPPGPFGLGTTNVTFTASDGVATSSCTTTITVADVTPPTISAPASVTQKSCATSKLLSIGQASASDNCVATPTVVGEIIAFNGVAINPPVPVVGGAATFGIGTYTVRWTTTDNVAVRQATQVVTVGTRTQASQSFLLEDRAQSLSSTLQPGALFNSGTLQTRVGNDAISGSITSVAPISILDRARTGAVASAGAITRAATAITGSLSPFSPVVLPALPALPTFPAPTGTAKVVNSGQTLTLAPGSYASYTVNSGGTLVLGAGDYFFTDLQVNSASSVVRAAATTRVFVQNTLTLRGSFVNNAGAVQTVYLGFAGASAILEAAFNGTLLAPNGQITFGTGSALTFRGGFLVKNIVVRPDAKLVCVEE